MTVSLQDYSDQLAQVVENVSRSVIRVEARSRVAGSGIAWTREGIILTADHVVEREENIRVMLPDGSEQEAELVGRDPATDLAALQVKNVSLVPAEIASPQSLKPGHLVFAVGKPWSNHPVVSSGIVSTIGQGRRGPFREGLIHADVTLYPGFSGGPLADASGRVIGMNSSVIGRGMGLAVPVETASRVMEELIKQGRVKRGYLGVGLQPVPLPESLTKKTGLSQSNGLMVLSVEPDSAAENGGLLPGDILIGLNGNTLESVHELQRWLSGERVDQTVNARLVRGGELKEIPVTIGSH